MAQVTRDIIQLKKSKTGDVFYPETHMQAVIGLNGNKDAKTVLAGPISGSAGPASFRPLYPTDIIPLFTKEYTYKCTANNTNNGNIYFMNVTPTSNDWATPWQVHYLLTVDGLTSDNANAKYCHGEYDVYMGCSGSNYYYCIFNKFYSSSYYPIYYHKLIYHNTEAKYNSYHISNPAKIGVRIQSAYGPNTVGRHYTIKVYDTLNCTVSFPEEIETYGTVYNSTYYGAVDFNGTSTGLQETGDATNTTDITLYYSRVTAGTNGLMAYSLIMQDGTGNWQSFTTKGITANTKTKNTVGFRLGSRIYYLNQAAIAASTDATANANGVAVKNGNTSNYYAVKVFSPIIDFRYSLNIVSNNSASGGPVGLTRYKPVYIVGTINASDGLFYLDDTWWTQDEPITEDGKIYIKVCESVYPDNGSNPDGQYRGDLVYLGIPYYYKNGRFQEYVIADSANTVPWSGVTGRPSFYDLVIKASDATTLLTYKPTTSGTYQLQLSASQIGLGNVENTKLSTWTGTSNITTLGTISTGTWHGSTIGVGYGGTGKTSWTQYGVLYADTTSSLSQVVNNTTSTRKFLRMVGSSNAATAPAWDTVTKTDVGLSNVENTALSTWAGTQNITTVGTITTGTWNATTISTGKGGTGLTTYTKGDMLYASANNTLAKLGANTGTKKFLSMASSVPSWEVLATTDLPAMYIGKTAVKFENTTEQALTGISTGAFSSSITVGNGSAPASNEQASTTQKRRIYFGSSNYYIEVDKNGYLHTNVGFYSDSFVSAGGLSNAGGSSGIDADALWELLAASTSEQINSSHLPKGSAADLNSGTSTTGVTWGAKTIADYVTSQINTTVSSALYFRGQSSTAITNGGTETATINGQALTAQTGDLVLYDGKEFAWDGSHWIQFGDESSWASKNISISTSGYLTGGGDLTTSRTISINTNKISDSSAASSLSSTSTNLVTERDIYYGLPTINNSHAYTSGTTIYAPTSAGTANQVLLSGGANTAPTWGNASGLSVGTASKLGSSTVGSTTKPIYLSSGTAIECNTYAGGTAVTLNGTSKAASTASFYAPTGAGTSGYILKSNGSGEPSWVAQSTLSVGTASKLGSATVGSTLKPIYLDNGTPKAVTNIDAGLVYGYFDYSHISYLVSHPEPTGGIVVPFLYNDIAFLIAQGGHVTIYSTTDTDLTQDTLTVKTLWKTDSACNNAFDASPSYLSMGNDTAAEMSADGIIIDIQLPRNFNHGNKFYIDFGTDTFGFSTIDILLKSEYDQETTYTAVVTGDSINKSANYTKSISHRVAGTYRFDRMRIHLTGHTSTTSGVRIAQIGLINYNSAGHRYTMMSRGYDDPVYRHITPNENITYDIGSSSKRWRTLYSNALNTSGAATIGGTLEVKSYTYLANAKAIHFKSSGGSNYSVLNLDSSNNVTIAYGTSAAGYNTYLEGNNIYFRYGTSHTTGITLASTGAVTIAGATTLSSTLAVAGLATLSGGISLGTQYTPSGSSTAVDSKLVWDNTNKAWHLIGNFYADGFISAGGLSNGSGTGGVDIDAVWSSLTNSSSDNYASTKIHTNHLPTIEISGTNVTSGSGTYTYTSASSSKLALTINVKDTTYSVVSSSANGLVPKTGSAASATIATQSTEWVLTTTSGGAPTWRKLPSTAFSTDTNTWRGVYTGGTSRVGTGTGTKAINFVAGSNVTVSYEAAGTGSGQSGSADYFNVKIAATDTKYTNGTGISLSGTTFSLNVSGAKTALGLGTMAYETASNYLTTITAASTYVKLSPGTSEQTISSSISSFVKGVINLWRSSGDHYTFLGFSNGTTETYLGGIGFKSQSDHNLYHKDGSSYYTIFDENNYTSYVNTTNFPGLNKTGTVTKVSTGTGLTGGDITTTGTISINSTYQGYITHGESAYNSLGNYLPLAGGTMTGNLKWNNSTALPSTTSTSYILCIDAFADGGTTKYITTSNLLGGYVLKAGDTMSGDLIIEKTGGGLTIRGERLNSNANGGYIYLAGRYYNNDRNGIKIAAEYPGSVGYDVQDLVFYTSNNRSGDASPVWVEAMRIKADTSVTINQAENITFKNGCGVKVTDNADTPSAYGVLYMSSNNNLILGYSTAVAGYNTIIYGNTLSFRYGTSPTVGMILNNSGNVTIGATDLASTTSKLYVDGALVATTVNGYTLAAACAKGVVTSMTVSSTSANLPTAAAVASLVSEYLPLAGGTMTGSIKLPNGSYINANSGYSMLGIGSGGETFYCGPGAEITSAFYLRSGNINLTHVKAGTNYTIWDASNSNLSTVDWAANNLTAAGTGTFNKIALTSTTAEAHLAFARGSYNYITAPEGGSINIVPNGLSVSANNSRLSVADEEVSITKASGEAMLAIQSTAANGAAGSIWFRARSSSYNGIMMVGNPGATSGNAYDRISLDFMAANATSSSSVTWKRALRITYGGNVIVGASGATSTYTQYGNMTVNGSITSTGDQVISSDATLKTNWKELNYTVKDIANVKIGIFDWKDGRGTSAGSVAQDWKKLIPELVHGDEGNMTLAYGQIALLNTVLLARHDSEQDKEIEELKNRIVALENEINQLKNGIQ